MNTRILMLTLSFIAFHATCMDQPSYPQLQLEQPSSKKIQLVKGYLYIAHHTKSAWLLSKTQHKTFLDLSSLRTTHEEPFILVTITDQENNFDIMFPARYLWNHNNGSLIKFTISAAETSGAKEENIDGCSFEVTCIKNPESAHDFQQKFLVCMNNFYRKPLFIDEYTQELVDNGFISNVQQELIHLPTGDSITKTTGEHGPKGISSEKKFIEMMQKEKIAPFKGSIFQFVMQRQMGIKKIN